MEISRVLTIVRVMAPVGGVEQTAMDHAADFVRTVLGVGAGSAARSADDASGTQSASAPDGRARERCARPVGTLGIWALRELPTREALGAGGRRVARRGTRAHRALRLAHRSGPTDTRSSSARHMTSTWCREPGRPVRSTLTPHRAERSARDGLEPRLSSRPAAVASSMAQAAPPPRLRRCSDVSTSSSRATSAAPTSSPCTPRVARPGTTASTQRMTSSSSGTGADVCAMS